MTTFLGILLVLLIVNGLLLFLSVNGSSSKLSKTASKKSEASVAKILPREASKSQYKKAV